MNMLSKPPVGATASLLARNSSAWARGPLLVALLALPLVARATAILESRGYVEATTVGTYVDNVNSSATGADTVTASLSIADSHIPGLSGQAEFAGSAAFGSLSGSGSTSATGYTALSYFQAQPMDSAYDVFTVYGSGPINLTLHYQFLASLTAPTTLAGGLVQGAVYLSPNARTDHSEEAGFNNIYVNGSGAPYDFFTYVPDASLGASQLFVGASTILVNPGEAFNLNASLGLFGEVQDLNYDGSTVSLSAAGQLDYWISFDSSDAYLVSQSGATYDAPTAGGAPVPESTATIGLLGLGLAMMGLVEQRRRRRPAACALFVAHS